MEDKSNYAKFFNSLEFPSTVTLVDNVFQRKAFEWNSPEMSKYVTDESMDVLTYDRHRAYGQHALDFLEINFIRGHNFATNKQRGFVIYTFGELKLSTNVFDFHPMTVKSAVYHNDFFFWTEGPAIASKILGVATQHESLLSASQPHNFILDLTWSNSYTFDEIGHSKIENSITQVYISPLISGDGYENYRSLSVFETLKNKFIRKLPLK